MRDRFLFEAGRDIAKGFRFGHRPSGRAHARRRHHEALERQLSASEHRYRLLLDVFLEARKDAYGAIPILPWMRTAKQLNAAREGAA